MRPHRTFSFKPSLLSCAIAVSAAGFTQSALAVDLCAGQTNITITAAATGDTCTVDTTGATLTLPSGQALDQGVNILTGDAVTSIAGTLSHSHAENVTGSSVNTYFSYAALHVDNNLSGALSNSGTIITDVSVSAAATGFTTTGTGYFHARVFASGAGIEVMGNAGAAISNSGQIDASVNAAVSAFSGSATGLALAAGISVRGNLNASLSNSGVVSSAAFLDGESGQAWAFGMGAEGQVSAEMVNSGRITVSAGTVEGSQVHVRAIGMFAGGSIGSGGEMVNSGVIDVSGVLTDRHGYVVGMLAGWESSGPAIPMTGDASVVNSGRITVGEAEGGTDGSLHGVLILGMTDNATFDNTATGIIEATGALNAHLGGLEIRNMAVDARATNAGLIHLHDGPVGVGVDIGLMSNSSRFENSGRIDVALAQSFGALGRGLSIGDMNDTTTVVNSGDVTVSALASLNTADAVGVVVGYLGTGAIVENRSDIDVEAGVQYSGVAHATAVKVQTLDGRFENQGRLNASVVMPDLGAYPEIPVGFPPPVSVGPSGTAMAFYAAAGSGQLVNSGEINGGILLDGSVSLANSGRLNLSSTVGAYVGGDYTQSGSGVLQLQLRDTSTYAALGVVGTADFTASAGIVLTLDPLAQISDGDVFEDVVFAGELLTPTGGFVLRDSSLFWEFSELGTDSTSLDLVAHLADVSEALGAAAAGLSSEQLAFAEDLLLGNLDAGYAPLLDALNQAPDAAAAADLIEQAGPALTGAAGFAARSATFGSSSVISARLAELRGAASGDAFQQNAVWIKPFLGMAEQDSVNGVDGYDVNTAGFVLGIDGDISENWRVGVGVASALTDVEGDKAALDVETVQLALYASYAISDSAALDLDISHVSNSFDSSRRVGFAGSTALANYDGRQFAVGAAVSNRVTMGEKGAFVPALQVRYNRFSLDGYSETGAGVFNLDVNDQTEDSLQWLARGGFEFGVGAGTLLASAGVGYDTLDAATATASFAGGGPTYVSNGIKPEATIVTGGLGYRYVTAKNLEINAAYDAESRGGDYLAQTVSVKFRLPF